MRSTTTRALWLTLCLGCGNADDVAVVATPAPRSESLSDSRALRPPSRPFGDPIAFVDLMTTSGASRVSAAWQYVDASIVEIDSNDPGPTLRPDGPPVRSHDVSPRPRSDGWDEAAWTPIEPEALTARRGHGHFALGWFRTRVTLPERIDDVVLAGTTVVLEIVADDYSEVWVDGRLAASPGDDGGGAVSGFNTPNRVVLTRSAAPGHVYDVAFLAMNAPLSTSPPNFLWVRSAVLDVYAPEPSSTIATGFSRIAGMVWLDGALLFADAGANTIYRYDPSDEHVGVWRSHSGRSDGAARGALGAVGIAADGDERVFITEPGRRRVVRVERTAATTVLARDLDGLGDVAVDARGDAWIIADGRVLRVSAEGVRLATEIEDAVALDVTTDALFVAEEARVTRRAFAQDGSFGPPSTIYEGSAIRDVVVDPDGIVHVARDRELVVLAEPRRTVSFDAPVRSVAIGDEEVFVATDTTLHRAQ